MVKCTYKWRCIQKIEVSCLSRFIERAEGAGGWEVIWIDVSRQTSYLHSKWDVFTPIVCKWVNAFTLGWRLKEMNRIDLSTIVKAELIQLGFTTSITSTTFPALSDNFDLRRKRKTRNRTNKCVCHSHLHFKIYSDCRLHRVPQN